MNTVGHAAVRCEGSDGWSAQQASHVRSSTQMRRVWCTLQSAHVDRTHAPRTDTCINPMPLPLLLLLLALLVRVNPSAY